MTAILPGRRRSRPSLLQVLQRVQMRVAFVAVLLVGASIFSVGLLALRLHIVDNLGLVARAVAYTVEPAVVFRDRGAAAESLTLAADHDPVAQVEVLDAEGHEFASWQRTETGLVAAVQRRLAALLLRGPVASPIVHSGIEVGSVRVLGSGRDLLEYVVISGCSALLGLLLSGMVAYQLSRRAGREIAQPLEDLARTAHAVRRERALGNRVALAGIAELHELGTDFNALLDELETWQAQWQMENASLEYQANHDRLTGLRNRSFFETRLQAVVDGAGDSGERVAVLFIDGDNLKSINDQFGHDAGDHVLRAVAVRLKAQLAEGDLVARLGGDEFGVLLAPLRDDGQAGRVAENIMAQMTDGIQLPGGGELRTSLSIGIAIFPDHADSAADLLRRADEAMYHAKRRRRGSYHVAGEPDRNDGDAR